MRTALRPNKVRQRVSQAETLPAPIQGLDAISPIAKMDPRRALVLDNYFPQPGYVELRRGCFEHEDSDEGANAVESLMVYNGVSASKMFGACNGKIIDFSSAGSHSDDITGLLNDRWQYVNIATSGGNFLWCCNGADTPRYYDGSSWASASITGITPAQIINVCVHKNRLWLVRAATLNAAYLGTDSIQGAATVFSLTGIFSKGGYLVAIATWTVDGGAGSDDLIAFITSEGQIAIYAGTNPASDFALKGVYDLSPPIGRRCAVKVGGDVALLTLDGVIPLSQALVTERAALTNIAMTKNIHPLIVQDGKDYGSLFGWEMVVYPRGTRALVNVPTAEGETQRQYVMNTVTGAWCRFTGWDASCFAVFNDRLFYGSNDGRVLEADRGGGDESSAIVADLKTAFHYFGGERGRKKHFKACRVLMTTDGTVTPSFALNHDFRDTAALATISSSIGGRALWDEAEWDVDLWPVERDVQARWVNARGLGYCSSVRMRVSVAAVGIDEGERPAVVLQINAFDLVFEKGNLL